MPRFLHRLAWAFAVLGGLCASAVALMTVVSIALRSLTSRPIQGDVELTQLGIALCISLCLPWCQMHGSNILVDFFTQHARARTVRRLDAFGGLLMALMVGLLAWRTGAGALAVGGAGEMSMILGLPMWWIYAALAPGLALAGIVALVQAGLRLAGRDPMAGLA
ncbi:MAG: TRAP transporter small permease subunit [Burkholderiaceae bacterium]